MTRASGRGSACSTSAPGSATSPCWSADWSVRRERSWASTAMSASSPRRRREWPRPACRTCASRSPTWARSRRDPIRRGRRATHPRVSSRSGHRTVRSLSQLIAPGGVLVVQDACWAPLFLQLTAHLPLWAACASLIHRSFERSGANMDMEQVLYRTFREAGLPAPSMRLEVPVGDDPAFSRWICDLTCSMRPRMQEHALSCEALGDFATLLPRLEAELAGAKSFGACIGLVGAWSRKPGAAPGRP